MNCKKLTFLFLLCLLGSQLSLANPSPSKRIEVYTLSQQFWDTKNGDTLGEIVKRLLPHNIYMQKKLMQDILKLNPDAFINNDPDRLIANKRLWLPSTLTRAQSKIDERLYNVESFSWGNIKRPRRD